MLPAPNARITCKVFDKDEAPEAFLSYTIEKTKFIFNLDWSSESFVENYSNNLIIWDLGDDTILEGPSATHFYKYPGFYDVKATIFDVNGDAHVISLEKSLTAKNVFPDLIHLQSLNAFGLAYNHPSGKPTNQIIVSRYNSWQNDNFIKDADYKINLYTYGSKSDYMSLSSYYANKYSHLKAYHGFVNVSLTDDNFIQTKLTNSTKTDSVSVYAVPYNTGYIDNDWGIKFDFFNHPEEGSSFVGTTGTNKNIDYVYFVDQKPSDSNIGGTDILYASFDSKFFSENFIDANNLKDVFQKSEYGYLNLPWSAQVVKSIFNSASSLRITSNGISVEGNNNTIGAISGQNVYPFDIYPVKWANTQIPFVITLKDSENYTVKNYNQIYNFHQGDFNNNLYDVNLKLVKYTSSDLNTSGKAPTLSAFEIKEANFSQNIKVPVYKNSTYFAGLLHLPFEAKSVAVSATLKIQDENIYKNIPIYGYLAQKGQNKIRRYSKQLVFDYCDVEELVFYFDRKLITFTDPLTSNLHICFSPVGMFNDKKTSKVYFLDGDKDQIHVSDIDGNILTNISFSGMQYRANDSVAPSVISLLGDNKSSSPGWCSVDREGNAYVTLTDCVTSLKFDHNTNVAIRKYLPPFENQKFYSSNLGINPPLSGIDGGNTIVPGSIDVDRDNNVYIAYTNPLSAFVCKYDNDGNVLNVIFFEKWEIPQEIVVDRNNDIWVGIENLNYSSSNNLDRKDLVYLINGKTLEKTVIRDIKGLGNMAIDSRQNLYVLNKTNTITKIDKITKVKTNYIFGQSTNENTYIKDIGAIAIDSEDQMWVVNNVDGKIYFADVDNLNAPLSSWSYEKLKDINLNTIEGLQSLYYTTGDWNGFKWINKFADVEIPEPRIISGQSSYFDILNLNPVVAKYGEEFDYLTQIKSYILQESLFDKKILLDDFIGQILGKNENVEEIGKVIYEKISNFVSNNSDIDVCNIQQLLSMAEETGTDLNQYLYSYPPSIRRALDILSITQKRLFGSQNAYNRSFGLSAYKFFENNNLGEEIDIKTGTFVAGEYVVTFELFSEKYKLITNTIIPNHKYGDIIPLSSVNYNWGWELVTATREQSGLDLKNYYKFYRYVPNKKPKNYDGLINFDTNFTTITLEQSSFDDWSRFGGTMDKVLSYGFYKGLKLSKFVTPTPTPSITPTQSLTPTNTITPTKTPTPSITVTRSQTPTITPTPSITLTLSPTNTLTPTNTPTHSQTPTNTPTTSQTPTNTPTPQVSVTPTRTSTVTPTVEQTKTPTITPTPTTTPNSCGSVVQYTGGQAFPSERIITLGSELGYVNFEFNAFGIPDRFVVEYNGLTAIDTGYRGLAEYQNALNTALGEFTPITEPPAGVAVFYKNSPNAIATVKVFAPLPGTAWTYTLYCPQPQPPTPTPTPTATRTLTPTPTITKTVTRTVTITPPPPSSTSTPTPTPTPTPTFNPVTPTPTPTPTITSTATPTPTPTLPIVNVQFVSNSIPLEISGFNFYYNISQIGTNNPPITCYRGMNYDFILNNVLTYPFALRIDNGDTINAVDGAYNNDTLNGNNSGVIMFTPNTFTPSKIIYQCTTNSSMSGIITILDQ